GQRTPARGHQNGPRPPATRTPPPSRSPSTTDPTAETPADEQQAEAQQGGHPQSDSQTASNPTTLPLTFADLPLSLDLHATHLRLHCQGARHRPRLFLDVEVPRASRTLRGQRRNARPLTRRKHRLR